jgi:hypothetical protein
VSFTTRLHFGREISGEPNRYIRFAYSGISVPDIQESMTLFKDWAEA